MKRKTDKRKTHNPVYSITITARIDLIFDARRTYIRSIRMLDDFRYVCLMVKIRAIVQTKGTWLSDNDVSDYWHIIGCTVIMGTKPQLSRNQWPTTHKISKNVTKPRWNTATTGKAAENSYLIMLMMMMMMMMMIIIRVTNIIWII